METAFYFFGGAADLFLSIMLWFILDDKQAPAVLLDGDRSYSVVEVLRTAQSCEINSDSDLGQSFKEDDKSEKPAGSFYTDRSSGIAERMIA